MRNKWLCVIVGLILLFTAVSCATPTSAPAPEPEAAPVQESKSEPVPEPVVEKSTFEAIVITGAASKKSPPFTVTTDEWVIDWSYESSVSDFAIFGFFVYPRGETMGFVESVQAGIGGETSGETYSYAGPGEYYVDVVVANIDSWEIVILPVTAQGPVQKPETVEPVQEPESIEEPVIEEEHEPEPVQEPVTLAPGYERSNPATIGTELFIEDEYIGETYKFNITLLEVVRGAEAWSRIEEANMFNDLAPSGFEYVLVKIRFDYLEGPTPDTSYDISPVWFTAVSSKGKDYERESVSGLEPPLRTSLYPGATHEGWGAFVVEKQDDKPLLTFGRDFRGRGGVWWQLYLD